jgi:hypothetical protein
LITNPYPNSTQLHGYNQGFVIKAGLDMSGKKSLAFRAVPLDCLQAKKDVGGF